MATNPVRSSVVFGLMALATLGGARNDDPPEDSARAKSTGPAASKPDPSPETRAQAAFDRLVRAGKDWRAELAASEELSRLGDAAVNVVIGGTDEAQDERVRRACYGLLVRSLSKNERAAQTVVHQGLSEKSDAVRYECAYMVGENKTYRAHRPLRRVFEEKDTPENIRYAAAKSLAQLGEPDVLRVLYQAVTADGYMARQMGNKGLKALSGKSLDDFEGYQFGEGATVSGGAEYMPMFDAVTASEKRAKRYAAATAYFKWLRAEHPELYKHLTGSF